MSAAFTPGPWFVHSSLNLVGSASGDVATVYCGGHTRNGDADKARGEANSRLIAAAPDHALIGWAMCVQDATWEEWGVGKGEFCFAGLRHATTLDEFGCPVLTDNLRELLTKARGDQ